MGIYTTSGQVLRAVKAAMATPSWQPPKQLGQVGRCAACAVTPSTLLTPNQLAVLVCGPSVMALHAYAQGVRGYGLRSSGQRAGGQWPGFTVAQWRKAFGYAAVHTTGGSNAEATAQKHTELIVQAKARAAGNIGAKAAKRQAKATAPAPTAEPTAQA